jgi:hypothetical protein
MWYNSSSDYKAVVVVLDSNGMIVPLFSNCLPASLSGIEKKLYTGIPQWK